MNMRTMQVNTHIAAMKQKEGQGGKLTRLARQALAEGRRRTSQTNPAESEPAQHGAMETKDGGKTWLPITPGDAT